MLFLILKEAFSSFVTYHISETSDGFNQFFIKFSVNLLAKIADVNINEVCSALIVIISDVVFELFSRKNNSDVSHHKFEHRIFLC